jgi:hypothetical protein
MSTLTRHALIAVYSALYPRHSSHDPPEGAGSRYKSSYPATVVRMTSVMASAPRYRRIQSDPRACVGSQLYGRRPPRDRGRADNSQTRAGRLFQTSNAELSPPERTVELDREERLRVTRSMTGIPSLECCPVTNLGPNFATTERPAMGSTLIQQQNGTSRNQRQLVAKGSRLKFLR